MNLCFTESIKDFPKYVITRDGKVISLTTNKILSPRSGTNKYLGLTLYNEKGKHTRTIHRLVAESFIPNPDSKPTVNHRNGNRTDNRVENLEWATYSENLLHSFRELGRKQSTKRGVVQLKDGVVVKIFNSLNQAKKEDGFSVQNIYACCRGRRKSHGGFQWMYL